MSSEKLDDDFLIFLDDGETFSGSGDTEIMKWYWSDFVVKKKKKKGS
jgi:hypothetical protein